MLKSDWAYFKFLVTAEGLLLFLNWLLVTLMVLQPQTLPCRQQRENLGSRQHGFLLLSQLLSKSFNLGAQRFPSWDCQPWGNEFCDRETFPFVTGLKSPMISPELIKSTSLLWNWHELALFLPNNKGPQSYNNYYWGFYFPSVMIKMFEVVQWWKSKQHENMGSLANTCQFPSLLVSFPVNERVRSYAPIHV